MSSESHDEAISQFCGVTGADEDRAKGLLEACDWNLELAINMHVDTDDGARPSRPSASNASDTLNAAGPSRTTNSGQVINIDDSKDDFDEDFDADGESSSGRDINRFRQHRSADGERSRGGTSFSDNDSIRPPIPPIRQVLVQNPVGYSPEMPQHHRYNTRPRNTSDVYDAFRDFQAEAQWQEMVQESGEASASDFASTSSKRRTLLELFRPPLDLMFRGAFVGARECGTSQNKWLLVNVQNGREFACQTLNRDVWSNQAVKDILKEHFIFWQVQHDSFEGQRYVQFYKVSSFPHVSIIDPRTGEQMKSWPTTIDHNSFCDSVVEFLTDHPAPDGCGDANKMKKLCVKDEDVPKTLYDESEETQLEAAIRISLQEAERGSKDSMNPDDDNSSSLPYEENSNSNSHPLQMDENNSTHSSAQCAARSSAENNLSNSQQLKQQHQSPPSPPIELMPITPENECKIALRFPDGTSLVKKFSNLESLAGVKSFVRQEKRATTGSIGFVAPPNKKLTDAMMSETLESLGLCPASRLEVIYGCDS